MWKKAFPVLAAVAFLLLANGVLTTALPLRLKVAGLSAEAIIALAAAGNAGSLLGVMMALPVVRRVGCRRSFIGFVGVFAAGSAILLSPTWPMLYGAARFATGAALSGLYLLIESRLNGFAPPGARKRLLSTYMIVFYTAQALGACLGGLAPGGSSVVAMTVVAILLANTGGGGLPLVPPAVISSGRVPVIGLLRLSPGGYALGFAAGVLLGSFYALGALFAEVTLSDASLTGPFMAAAMIGGVCGLLAISAISCHHAENVIAIAVSVASCAAALLLAILPAFIPSDRAVLLLVVLFGLVGFSLYPLASVCVNSDASEITRVDANALFIFVAASGGIVGPVVAGSLVGFVGPNAAFWVIGAATLGAAIFSAACRRGHSRSDLSPAAG